LLKGLISFKKENNSYLYIIHSATKIKTAARYTKWDRFIVHGNQNPYLYSDASPL
jgi:hypothetical protein